MEDNPVLGHRDPPNRLVERSEVGVLCAAVGVTQLVHPERERGTQLDESEHAALQRPDAVDRRIGEPLRPAQVRG